MNIRIALAPFKTRLKSLLFLILLFIALIVPILSLYLFKIKTVKLYSNIDVISKHDLLTFDENLFFVSTGNISENLMKNNPLVKNAKVIRKYPNELIIRIEERIPVARIYQYEEKFLVDNEGRILPNLSRLKGDKYPQLRCKFTQIQEGDFIVDKSVLFGLEISEELSATDANAVKLIECISEEKLSLEIKGIIVLVSPKQEAQKIASSLLFLLKQFRIEGEKPDTIDLRYDKPVYIPDNLELQTMQEEGSTSSDR